MENIQEQDISACIQLERNIYALHFSGNVFLYLKQFKSYSGLYVIAFYFEYYRIAKKIANY